ncbi:MAG: GTP cyclohydrolase [Bacteroidota bacterium]
MKVFNYFKKYSLLAFFAVGILVTGCGDDDAPDDVNEVEVITDVKLIFTNDADATDVVEASAQDPDGDGVLELAILDPITLDAGKTYTLTYEIFNNLDPNDSEDIGAEILDEDDEHQIFFSFTDGAFSDPIGDGNIDNAADPINYNDQDENGRPVGLSTTWTTATSTLTGGMFTANLQHQPENIKTDTSGATDGDTDFLLTFTLNIQ